MTGLEMAPSYENIFIGGAVNSAIQLSKDLSNAGHRINIVTTTPRNSSSYSIDWVNIYQIPIGRTYGSLSYGAEYAIKSSLLIRKLNKKEKFQIIHGHSGFPSVASVSKISSLIIGTPSVHTLYCPVHVNDRFARSYLSGINVIIAISENVKKSLNDAGIISQRIEVVPPSINSAIFNPSVSGNKLRTNLNIDRNDKVILFVGNFTITKGIDILLESMKDLIIQFPEMKLIITSELPHQNYARRKQEIESLIAKYDLGKNIIRLGIIKNMPELMAASDILVAPFFDTNGPSDYPIPILEAMGIGKPVIASDVGGISELISNLDNGVLIEPNNVKMLSDSISFLLNSKAMRNQIGLNAAEFITRNFSISKINHKMESIYEEIIR